MISRMIKKVCSSIFTALCFWAILFISCERHEFIRLVKLLITSTSDITIGSVLVEADFIDFGDNPILEYGFCVSENRGPDLSDYYSTVGNNPESYSFNTTISNLGYGKKYYINAFAKTKDSVYYSNETSFSTLDIHLPKVTTTQPSFVTSSSAISGGVITDMGNSENVVCGVCWGTAIYPTIRDTKTVDIPDQGIFTSNITTLNPGTIYYIRSYVTNEAGTVYGSEISFTTLSN